MAQDFIPGPLCRLQEKLPVYSGRFTFTGLLLDPLAGSLALYQITIQVYQTLLITTHSFNGLAPLLFMNTKV